jgi:hypothetical protein
MHLIQSYPTGQKKYNITYFSDHYLGVQWHPRKLCISIAFSSFTLTCSSIFPTLESQLAYQRSRADDPSIPHNHTTAPLPFCIFPNWESTLFGEKKQIFRRKIREAIGHQTRPKLVTQQRHMQQPFLVFNTAKPHHTPSGSFPQTCAKVRPAGGGTAGY